MAFDKDISLLEREARGVFLFESSRLSSSFPGSFESQDGSEMVQDLARSDIRSIHEGSLSELSGEIEMDEAMFGGRVPGKRGWGAAGKRMVFGLYQRNGKVLAFPVTNRGTQDLLPLMTRHAKAGSLYYTDDWHAYTFLDIRGNHVVIKKDKGKPKGRDHINGIEGFWSYAKHWLYHYRGVPKKNFHLYLKETEWRFNHRNENVVTLLRKLLSQRVVKEQTLVQL